ncbi:hypothetical protein IEQ34_011088 [Dendrobium chrysotoxum]|uniref:Uncharacterized protein n=1 Tax=Dendrobium chrysotoxum TaxID=161865 RepID=A0AAV7GF53_DENCH|nr:hypothetical protein IEQ34_011088 [Dendrobium chrysotoxum]
MEVNHVKLVDPGFFDGKTNSCSFLDALSGDALSVSFVDLKTSTFRGMPSLWISKEKVLALAAPFAFFLVGYFPNSRPFSDMIRKFFFRLKLTSEFFVTLLDSRLILIKLCYDMDYCKIFAH